MTNKVCREHLSDPSHRSAGPAILHGGQPDA